jgi:hypothetical protein
LAPAHVQFTKDLSRPHCCVITQFRPGHIGLNAYYRLYRFKPAAPSRCTTTAPPPGSSFPPRARMPCPPRPAPSRLCTARPLPPPAHVHEIEPRLCARHRRLPTLLPLTSLIFSDTLSSLLSPPRTLLRLTHTHRDCVYNFNRSPDGELGS